MKLYLYKEYWGAFSKSEAEVKETPKTYIAIDNYFMGDTYMHTMKKDNIGAINNNIVAFLEPKEDVARQMFIDRKSKEIDRAKTNIARLENEIKMLNESEDK